MHLPDGLINNGFSAPILAAVAAFVFQKASQVSTGLWEKVKAKKLALNNGLSEAFSASSWKLSAKGKNLLYKYLAVGSFVWAVQMLDFFKIGGHSGHIIGAALASLVLGANLAVVLMSLILLLQALVLSDGGLLVLGFNIVTMGIIAVYMAQFVFRRINTPLLAIFSASFLAVLSAAFVYSLILVLIAATNWQTVLAIMEVHLVVAVLEGLLNCLIIYIFFPKLINPHKYA